MGKYKGTSLSTVTNADPWQTTHQYAAPGEYVINITAYNLHSDESYGYNGYTDNMTRVVTIQNPVEDWIINFGNPPKIIDADGRKDRDGYILKL